MDSEMTREEAAQYIHQLEQRNEGLKEAVDRRDLALKLEKNREFRKVILEDFCGSECARYAQASADPNLKPEYRADALAMAQAAGHLRRFLSVIVQMGNKAEEEIRQNREEIDQLRENGEDA